MIDAPGVNEFIDLSDAPHSYSGQTGKVVKVNATETAVEFGTGGGGGSSTFIGLTDVPASYSGAALQGVRVNATQTGLEFFTLGGGTGTVTSVAVTTANGVSGSVSNPTTSAAITLTLGAITPSSVAATGTVTGSNLSGTNTGDNATNTTYANDYRAANFVAGTNYLAPAGNGSALTGITASQVGAVATNVAITGATNTKITYDSKGLVTAGSAATTADIADSLNKRYVTDANLTVIGNTSGTNSGDNATNTQYASDYRAANFIAGTNYVAPNVAITGATKTKITYDAKGLVTAGADATTADIAASTNKNYVTDAQLVIIGNTSGTNTGDNATNSQYSGLATSKQDTLTLTTTGTSGAATLIGATLNIPQYSGGSGGTITTQDEGSTLSTTVTTLNFTGAGVTASGSGATTTINIPGGAGSFAVTSAEVDFGTVPVQSKRITVTDASITPTSKIMVTPNGATATGRVGNDWEWDSIVFSAVAGTGNFLLTGTASGRIVGKRKIYYTYS